MRVAFPYSRSPLDYDPANITLAPEYIFLENVFSPLIEMDVHGSIVSGVAERFEWVGDEAILTIRRGLKTIDGYEIGVDDVAVSLKRLLILAGNTHGNLQGLLCQGHKLQSLDEECPGIVISGNKLILKPGGRKPFLLPMLSAIDFAVIPKDSIDPVNLEIKDFRNTSGPYFVHKYEGSGHLTLRANPSHYNYSDKIPQEVQLVPMDPSRPTDSLRALVDGEVDVVTTIDAATPEDMMRFYEKHSDRFVMHATLNVRNIVLGFTERGQKIFSRDERRYIGRKVRELFAVHCKNTLSFKPGIQFFPVYGEGGLSQNQLEAVKDVFNEAPHFVANGVGEKINIVRLALHKEFDNIFSEVFPGVETVMGQSPNFTKYDHFDDMPPMFIAGPDTGFLEDIGLVSYSMSAGYFNIPKSERAQWLADYGDFERKEDRISKLNALHFDTLMDATTVPLAVAPYVALATKDWDIGLSKMFANNQLWLFKRK